MRRPESSPLPIALHVFRLFMLLALAALLACENPMDSTGGIGGTADNGGVGGTGVSQGTVSAFGSIFVNGVEWDLDQATIEVGGAVVPESSLKLGMQVRVEGSVSYVDNTGEANSVVYRNSIAGPIESDPVPVTPDGLRKRFSILGQTVTVGESETVFADGATYAGLAKNQVIEVSGFENAGVNVRATRVALTGVFPTVSSVELNGLVSNLATNPDGSGIFEIGSITVRYLAGTEFSGLRRDELADGIMLNVSGDLRVSGSEIDADEIALEVAGFGQEDAQDAELAGFISEFVSMADFKMAGIPVDASGASLEPEGAFFGDGVLAYVEGRLEAGTIIGERLEAEDEEIFEVHVEAAASAVDPVRRELTLLGITVVADPNALVEDQRDGDETFEFGEILPGDWLTIDGAEIGPGRVTAVRIIRGVPGSDVVLKAGVTALDRDTPSLSVLDQPIPLESTTSYFSRGGYLGNYELPRTEEQFFRSPGDVDFEDIVEVRDRSAEDPGSISEVDEIVVIK